MTQASRARADAGECDSIPGLVRLETLGFTYAAQDVAQHETVKKKKQVLLHKRWEWKLEEGERNGNLLIFMLYKSFPCIDG